MNPKYKVGDQIDCDAITGWVDEVFQSTSKEGSYVYGVREPESDFVYFYHESDLV